MVQTKKRKAKPRSWWRKRHIVLACGVVMGLLLVVLGQILYPTGRALPYARIADSQVGGKTYQEVAEQIRQEYADLKLRVVIPNRDGVHATTAKAGITPGYRDAAKEVTEYSVGARLVPGSFIYKMLRQPVLGYEVDPQLSKEFIASVLRACRKEPTDATIILKDEHASIKPDSIGQECSKGAISTSLRTIRLQQRDIQLTLKPTVIKAEHTSDELEPLLPLAASAIDPGLRVRTAKDAFDVPKEMIASWMQVSEKDGKYTLVLDQTKVTAYLESLRGKLYIEPGVTTVRYEDGVETGTQVGGRGQGADTIVTSTRLASTLLDGDASTREVWMALTILEPRVDIQRTYSASDKGAQAMIEQWDRDHSARFGIMLRDLSDKGVNAQLNPDADFVTASTYKMFLAYAVLHKVETGELHMDNTTDMGLSVGSCIEEMILHSTNACATSLMELAGWSYVHSFIKEQFPRTSLDNGTNADNEKHTSVRDETNFLIRLNGGELMNQDNTDYLLSLMKRQVYRSGIPRGVPGVTVANKVGFYVGYKHDVAIIYAGRGTYVFSVLSYGSNDSQIADISRRVAELMR